MAIIKNLDKNLVKKDNRFTLISDDGDGVRTFGYKTLELTTQRTGGMTYLYIHFDRSKYDFTSDEWLTTAGSELTDMFNGVENVNVERLVCVCDKIIAEIERLQADVEAEADIDMTDVSERLKVEYVELYRAIEEAKRMEWWKLADYSKYNTNLVWASREIQSAEKSLEKIEQTMRGIDTLPRKRKKELADNLAERGYVYERTDDIDVAYGVYHIENLREYINKCKEV